jgi:hypothetical protein
MTTLHERTRIYEILIRFHPEGPPAAIQRHVHEVLRGEEVIAATEQPAQPLDVDAVAALVGQQTVQLLAENARLKAILTPEQRRVLGIEAGLLS